MKEGGTGLHKTIREINLVYKGFILISIQPLVKMHSTHFAHLELTNLVWCITHPNMVKIAPCIGSATHCLTLTMRAPMQDPRSSTNGLQSFALAISSFSVWDIDCRVQQWRLVHCEHRFEGTTGTLQMHPVTQSKHLIYRTKVEQRIFKSPYFVHWYVSFQTKQYWRLQA